MVHCPSAFLTVAADLPEYFKPSDWLLDDTSFSAGGISDQA